MIEIMTKQRDISIDILKEVFSKFKIKCVMENNQIDSISEIKSFLSYLKNCKRNFWLTASWTKMPSSGGAWGWRRAPGACPAPRCCRRP